MNAVGQASSILPVSKQRLRPFCISRASTFDRSMFAQISALPPIAECLQALHSELAVQRLRYWDANWDILCAFPEKTLAVQAAEDLSSEAFQELFQSGSAQVESQELKDFPPFISGWLGYVQYEFAAFLEPGLDHYFPSGHQRGGSKARLMFARYTACLAQKRGEQKVWVFSPKQADAEKLLQQVQKAVHLYDAKGQSQSLTNQVARPAEAQLLSPLQSSVDERTYKAQVESLKRSIDDGVIFQANLSREISAHWSGGQLLSFAERLLSNANPRFGYFGQWEGKQQLSLSPELHFKVQSVRGRWQVEAEPIKGTRPRGKNPEEDVLLSQDLLQSEKDRAENVMIADLVRNDLSLVCEDDSIAVPELCSLRSTARVHHLQTRVRGILNPKKTAMDALLAQFPCGSITGAPKWRSMELLAQLEKHRRDLYCGSIGYLEDRGHACFAVAIRTLQFDQQPEGWLMRFGTGGGITTLSDPEEEWKETQDKAADLVAAMAVYLMPSEDRAISPLS